MCGDNAFAGESIDERNEVGLRAVRLGATSPSITPSVPSIPASPSRFLPQGPPAATPRLASLASARAMSQPQCDEDGFLTDSANSSRRHTGDHNKPPAPLAPPQSTAHHKRDQSDGDSDDGFLARVQIMSRLPSSEVLGRCGTVSYKSTC